ncbi:hypothetical protein CIB84_010577, partial [Bambusicola thoracicus]
DPRVKGWLLLENYTPTFIFSVLYLLIVWLGPKYMRNKQPFSCRGILVVYNLGLTLLSLYMFYELVTGVWEGGYNFYCQDTRSGGEADMKIIRVLWWYYFSKLIEFMDTFFFILRKNNHQITVLHVYHHATMLNIWWFVMNWVPCGHCKYWVMVGYACITGLVLIFIWSNQTFMVSSSAGCVVSDTKLFC